MARNEEGGRHEKPGPEKGQAFGITSVTHALKGVDFPKSKKELISEYGDEEIEFKKDQGEPLRDVLEMVSQEQFNSMSDLTAAIGDAYREHEEEGGRGRSGAGRGGEREESRSARASEQQEGGRGGRGSQEEEGGRGGRGGQR